MNARHMLYTRQATIDRCHTLSICLHIKGRAPVSGIHICYAALSIGKTNLRRSDFTIFSSPSFLPQGSQKSKVNLCLNRSLISGYNKRKYSNVLMPPQINAQNSPLYKHIPK